MSCNTVCMHCGLNTKMINKKKKDYNNAVYYPNVTGLIVVRCYKNKADETITPNIVLAKFRKEEK